MTIDELLAQIVALNSADRRRLFRRAQRMGLLTPADLSTGDAPETARTTKAEKPKTETTSQKQTTRSAKTADPTQKQPTLVSLRPAPPAATPKTPPHNRKPLIPTGTSLSELRVRVVFDGGSKGNPGQGYGSYALVWPGQAKPEIVRLTYGDRVTNNEAEYDTLINALQDLLERVKTAGGVPTNVFVEIWGDSQLVVNQVNGSWKINKPPLQARCDKARSLLQQFGFAALNYHPREESVALLGH